MTSTNILYFALGLGVGYIFVKNSKVRNLVEPIAQSVIDITEEAVIDVKDALVDTAKTTKCEAEWVKFSSTAKFGSKEGAEQAKKDFMAKCMA